MPTVRLNRNQREAAIMSGIEAMATVAGTQTEATLEWHRSHTDTIVQRIKAKTPDHGNREIPYKTLIVKIITAHRDAQ